MSRTLFDRRTLLRRTGSITVLGAAHRAVTGSAAAQASGDVSITHSVSGYSRSLGSDETSSLLRVAVEGVRLGGEEGHWFRITSEEGKQVRVEPERDETTTVQGTLVFDIYGGNGEVLDDPLLDVPDEEIPVSVSGETGMFASDPIFDRYTIDVVAGTESVASTDGRLYGIGYPSDMSQDGRTGEIDVTYPRVGEVEETWAVVLVINTYHGDGYPVQGFQSEFEHHDTEFVTTVDTARLEPVPEDGFRDYDVLFYADGDPDTGVPNLWASGSLALGDEGNDQATVDAEVTAFDTPDVTVEPGDAVTSEVFVRNTGTVEHEFFVGYDVVAPDNRHFNGDGSTGETLVLGPGEEESVEVTWLVTSEAPAGSYDTITAVWRESDDEELETTLDRAENPRAFELTSGAFPAGTAVLPPVTPEQFPYSHTQGLDFPGLGLDGEGISGNGVRVTVDREWVGDDRLEVRVGVEDPEESLLKDLYGYGSSQVLLLYDSDALSVERGDLRSSVAGGEPRAIDIGSTIVSLVSLGSASSVGALVKEAVKSVAEEVGKEWATSRLVFDTPPDFEGREGGISVVDVDFGTETMPGATSPSTVERYELRATFSVPEAVQESAISVVADMRGFTRPLPNPNPITRAFGTPVEYRRQVTVPVDRATQGAESTATDGSGPAETAEANGNQSGTPGFGVVGTLASLGGVSYLLKRREERNS